jgi:hypothetical protein
MLIVILTSSTIIEAGRLACLQFRASVATSIFARETVTLIFWRSSLGGDVQPFER